MKQFKIFIMLSKAKLYILVLSVAISLGLMPVGALINGYIRNEVSAEIPNTLLQIQEEVLPEIESQFLGLGIPEVLDGIRNMLAPNISDDVVKVEAIPDTLLILQNRTLDKLPLIINSTGAANIIYNAIANLTIYNGSTWDNARNQFFNNYTFQDDFSTAIEGISERMMGGTVSLNYSSTTYSRILYGYTLGDTVYPGILTDLETGVGLIEWLDFYADAENDTDGKRGLMETVYACSWNSKQLQNVSAFITTYLWPEIVKKEYEPLDIETYANSVFYSQWTNGSYYPSGLNLEDIFEELEDEMKSIVGAYYISKTIREIKLFTEDNETLAREWFFNNYTVQTNISSTLKGVSEHVNNVTYSLNYTSTAQERLFDGYLDSPGLLTQISAGLGLVKWMVLYDFAIIDIGTRNLMETTYNATWNDQLLPLGEYIRDYLIKDVVAAVEEKGLELGIPDASNIINSTVQDLWDPSNSHSIVNESGIKKWFDAYKGDITAQNELNATFNMDEFLIYNTTHSQFYRWVFNTIRLIILPILFTYLNFQGENVTPLEYAPVVILMQWANGTVDSSGLDLDPFGSGTKGFEVGVPTPSNISLSTATALFDKYNKSTFINKDGLLKWIEAYEVNSTVQAELMNIFQLNNTQFNMITNWLFTTFRNIVVPNMVEIATVYEHPITHLPVYYTLEDLTVFEFYRQWTNGSLFKEGLDPGASLIIGVDSLDGWEVGIPTSTNINKEVAEILWSPTTIWNPFHPNDPNDLALTNHLGFPKWFKAMEVSSTYNYLKNALDLNNDQMDAILDWLNFIRDNFALSLLQEESGLPLNHDELGNIYFMSFIISGSVLLAISALFTIWLLLTKRK